MIYVIHNPARHERALSLRKEFEVQGITKFKTMSAVMENPPKTGISKAHRSCVQHAKQVGSPFCIIMEDDVKFTAKDSWSRFLENLYVAPDDTDILLAGIYTAHNFKHKIGNFHSLHSFSGLHCYAVFEQAYDRFLEAPDDFHIDKWLGDPKKGNLKCYVIHPFLAVQQDGFYSDNKKQVKTYSHLLSKYKLYEGH